jgi:hypothetical protein
MRLPNELTTEQHAALVECLRIFHHRGVVVRQAREQHPPGDGSRHLPFKTEDVNAPLPPRAFVPAG